MERSQLQRFSDLPNVGTVIEKSFVALGMARPIELIGKDPYDLYNQLCKITQKKQDPCVLDVFISAVRYMEGGPPKKWWEFTEERKRHLGVER